VTWDAHPDRDEEWAEEQRSQLGNDRFQREYECKFITEDETLIAPQTLAGLSGVDPEFSIGKNMWWYEEPKPNHTFGVGWDPATGTANGPSGDYAAIQILDLTTMTQVAEWRDNKTVTQDQVEIMRKSLFYIYHTLTNHPDQESDPEIYWTVENNGVGEAALVAIDSIGEENFPGYFVHEPRKSGGSSRRKGLNTAARSKMAACTRFKSLVESRRLTIKSRALVTELKNFVRGGGSFKAKIGMKDDLVLSMLHVIRLLQVVANWDDSLSDTLRIVSDSDDYDTAPMPIVI
jgi:hypothetical protein